jgi:GNAT superfamily N-acetyltransferase
MSAVFALPSELVRDGLSLRKADERDRPFQRAVFGTARRDAQLLAQWPGRDALYDSQFELQSRHFAGAFPEADVLIVERDGVPIGRLILDRAKAVWWVVDIALMPAARGKGIGTALLRQIQDAARVTGAKSVGLHVELGNPAHALYARLGFTEIESESGLHAAMIWTAPS